MRRTLAAAVLGAGLATAVIPTAPASAVCLDLHVEGLRCVMPCYTVYGAYVRADDATKDRLPDPIFQCLA